MQRNGEWTYEGGMKGFGRLSSIRRDLGPLSGEYIYFVCKMSGRLSSIRVAPQKFIAFVPANS